MSENDRPMENATPEERAQARQEELCAYAFGELEGDARSRFEERLAGDAQLRADLAELEATTNLVTQALPKEALPDDMRATIRAAAEHTASAGAKRARFRFLSGGLSSGAFRAAAGLLLVVGVALAVLAPLLVSTSIGFETFPPNTGPARSTAW